MKFLADTYIRIAVIATLSLLAFFHFAPELEKKKSISKRRAEAVKIIQIGEFKVAKVLDGDTITTADGRRVRLIGIDTPELHHPELPVQRFAEEASEYASRLLSGKTARIESEAGNLTDNYGRTLAYVYVDGVLVNLELIRRGYAYAYTRFDFSKRDKFIEAEKSAREAQYGLWNYSLRDGRLANIAASYESLNLEGKRKFDLMLESLTKKYGQKSMPPGPEPAQASGSGVVSEK